MKKDNPNISLTGSVKKAVDLANQLFDSHDKGLSIRAMNGRMIVRELLP